MDDLKGSWDEEEETPAMEAAEPEQEQAMEAQAGTEEPLEVESSAEQPEAGADWSPLIEQFRQAGFNSMEDIHAAMAQNQAEQAAQGQLSEVWQSLQQMVDDGEMTADAAQMVYDSKAQVIQMEAQVQAQQAQMAMQAQQQAVGQLSKIAPELGQAAMQAGLTPEQVQALAPVLQAVMAKNGASSVSQYVAQKGAGAATTPIPQGASAQPGAAVDTDYRELSFGDLFDSAPTGRR